MKTRILLLIIIAGVIISAGTVSAILVINEPKTAKDCRFTYGKGGPDLLACLEKIKENISTQKPSKVGPVNLHYQQCADLFTQIYEEFASRPSCEQPTGATCEPELFENIIRNHEEFYRLNCGSELENWAYLSEYNDVAWGSLGPMYEVEVQQYNNPGEPIEITLNKWGYKLCDNYRAEIINRADKSIVWERESSNSCVVLEPSKWQKFSYRVTVPSQPLIIDETGEYRVLIYLNDEHDPSISGYFNVLPKKE